VITGGEGQGGFFGGIADKVFIDRGRPAVRCRKGLDGMMLGLVACS